MTTLFVCKDCTYYNLNITALTEHESMTGHDGKVIHTSTNLDNIDPMSDTSDYKTGFAILMNMWEYFPESDHETIDKKLRVCGL